MRAAIDIRPRLREQPEVLPGSPGEALHHPSLLIPDGLHEGGVSQREAPSHPAGLVVVIDENGLAVFVHRQAVQVQAGDLAETATGALQEQIGEHDHVTGPLTHHTEGSDVRRARRPRERPKEIELGVELSDHVGGNGPALLGFGEPAVDVAPPEGECWIQARQETHRSGLLEEDPAP